jgi:hypothetical protein
MATSVVEQKLAFVQRVCKAGNSERSPDEQSDIRDFLHLDPAYRCAHAGYALGLSALSPAS